MLIFGLGNYFKMLEGAEAEFHGLEKNEILERLIEGLRDGNIEIVGVDWLEDL